jgi:hypothetical protein
VESSWSRSQSGFSVAAAVETVAVGGETVQWLPWLGEISRDRVEVGWYSRLTLTQINGHPEPLTGSHGPWAVVIRGQEQGGRSLEKGSAEEK